MCSLCVIDEVEQGYDTYLTPEHVRVTTAENDCCYHVATNQISIPLEKITDVVISNNWCLDLCGLKTLEIQTAGTPSAEGKILFLSDPEGYKVQILNLAAKKRPKVQLMSEEDYQAMSAFEKIKVTKEYAKLGILSESEYYMLLEKVIQSEEFVEEKERLLAGMLAGL